MNDFLICDENPTGIEWVSIPSGEFLSGSLRSLLGSDTPATTRAFEIGKYPVTNAQYKIFLDVNPDASVPAEWDAAMRTYPEGKGSHPVCGVSYNQAMEFCRWGGYRLPDGHEWEKAARGTDGRSYPWGSHWENGIYCNCEESGIGGTTPVDAYPKGVSPYGVWDMAGNASEWCSDRGQNNRTAKVVRGGSYNSPGWALESWLATENGPDDKWPWLGFRCVKFIKL